MEISTIGFTKPSAASFFGRLRSARVEQLVDVRVHNVSQLAGFAKRDDLRFFLRELCSVGYCHEPLLAPTEELLKDYRNKVIRWTEFEKRFMDLLETRDIAHQLSRVLVGARPVLLCSEHTPERCHRRLVAEYLNDHWGAS